MPYSSTQESLSGPKHKQGATSYTSKRFLTCFVCSNPFHIIKELTTVSSTTNDKIDCNNLCIYIILLLTLMLKPTTLYHIHQNIHIHNAIFFPLYHNFTVLVFNIKETVAIHFHKLAFIRRISDAV